MNMSQNNTITRYKTDLSKNINVVNARNILKIMNIDDLCKYTKLIFEKNLKNKIIFVTFKIFNHMFKTNFKNNANSFIKD
jgi:site-specific recombinase XerD